MTTTNARGLLTKAAFLVTALAGPAVSQELPRAALVARTDTIDTFESSRGGAPQPGNRAVVVRSLSQSGGRWLLVDTWYDSSAHETARQSLLTAPGSLATEREWVRAIGDSATLLVGPSHVTAWVVPQGRGPRLFDGDGGTPRYNGTLAAAAIARSRPAVGRVFVYPSGALYGSNPLEVRPESLKVVRRDTLFQGTVALPVVVLERPNGNQFWLDETTGAEVLSRGGAGPTRWWWHIRRGVSAPAVK